MKTGLLVLLLSGCAVAEPVEYRPPTGAPPADHPEILNGVITVGRVDDDRAARIVFEVYGAPTDVIPVVTWVEGIPCPSKPSRRATIPLQDKCYLGWAWSQPTWCEPYAVWPDDDYTHSGTIFAHELAHCASLRLGLGVDADHSGWIWNELDTANAALVQAGL